MNEDRKDRVVRQFVTYCRMALKYEKINYYNERKRIAERELHIKLFSEKQLEAIDKIFDTYHADYFYVMGYEIGIVDGDLAQALRELPDRQLQIVLMYYFIGWTDREIGEILGLAKSTVCKWRNDTVKTLRRLVEGMYYGE
ncbi:MAG: sigma-70 family RNA polymerase sigma factor [Lachnospiraceae bacterium]|nr:sigma-70 family RNA polymerase sigma factor [Lachnospiraceae bacterium]